MWTSTASGLTGVGEHDVVPARLARLGVIPGYRTQFGKILKEHPRLDVAFDLLAERREEDLTVLLVGVRDRRNHHVQRAAVATPASAGTGRSSRYGLTPQASSATASRSADSRPRPNQEPDQQRHRDRQAQGLRESGAG